MFCLMNFSRLVDFCPRMRYIFHMAKQQAEEKVFSFMEKHGMIHPGDKIILGVSGGADSVCLLFLLLEYRKKVPFEITVVHVNHGIRGEAAREDARWVEALCGEQGLAFRLVSEDVRELAAREKCSEEDAGRRLRYEAFRKAAEESGATKIAVAHNAGDRAETMLLHLFRGSGLKGLRGIEPVRQEFLQTEAAPNGRINGDSQREAWTESVCRVDIVRPVLCLERREIEEYLQERRITWRTDATNGEDGYTRNRVRHHLLPWAEREISGRVVSHMCRTADILSETEDYLRQQTLEALEKCTVRSSGIRGRELEIDVAGFLACHAVLQKRMALALAEELSPTGKDISAVHVEEIISLFEKEGNRSVSLPFGICFRRRYGKVAAGRWEAEQPGRSAERPESGHLLRRPEELPELEITHFFVKDMEKVPENQYTKQFDCDKIKESPVLRFRQKGDYLTLSDGRGNMIHKSLKDYMIGKKIPREMRERIPVLAEGSHVLWLIGYRISEYYKTDRNTKRILQVKLKGNCTDRETEEKMSEHIRVLLPEEEVAARIREIGEQISRDYAGKSIHLVCVLKGGSFFMCELAKRITVPVSLDFMSVSSYGSDTKSSGVVKIVKDLDEPLQGKDVLVVEDIVDSGRTLSYLLEMLRDRGPASLRLCTLLDKPDRRVIDVNVDYTGFKIPDEFVVGYGLDYDQMYRNLPYIGVVEFDK